MTTLKEKLDRIVKIDNAVENGLRLPVVNIIGWKRLKEERAGLVAGLIQQGKRESK